MSIHTYKVFCNEKQVGRFSKYSYAYLSILDNYNPKDKYIIAETPSNKIISILLELNISSPADLKMVKEFYTALIKE